jgi:hypothetical protein
MNALGETIDKLTLLELRPKNFPTNGLVDKLYAHLRERVDRPHSLLAAGKLKEAVNADETVIIITGFAVPPVIPIGETDGPLGAASLARAINFGLKGKVLILVDECQVDMLESTCRAAELRVVRKEHFGSLPHSTAVHDFPLTTMKESREIARQILDDYNPSAVISVERAGRNEKGVYHTAFGHDMSGWTPKIDSVIDEARRRNVLTIGVGDWGNEAGLGTLKGKIEEIMPNGSHCRCPCGKGIATTVEADIPLVVTCSNLGAYGMTACLSALLGISELLQDVEIEEQMIRECLRNGGMEAVQAIPSLKTPVDAISKEGYFGVLRLMRAAVEQALREIPLSRAETE